MPAGQEPELTVVPVVVTAGPGVRYLAESVPEPGNPGMPANDSRTTVFREEA